MNLFPSINPNIPCAGARATDAVAFKIISLQDRAQKRLPVDGNKEPHYYNAASSDTLFFPST
jgi:hypothetical protein